MRSVFPVIYIGLVTSAIFLAFDSWAYDDPFITYRYADNLANGLGFVYNPGEQVLSATTPLFVILLAALRPSGINLSTLSNFIGAFSLAAGGVFLWDIGHSYKTPIVGWTALGLYPTFPQLLAALGSEMPLYLALCLGSFALYARQKYAPTMVFAALAVLTRPDGVIIPALIILHYWFTERKLFPWKSLSLFLGLILPWLVFSWIYFGSPLPTTLVAKQHQGAMLISQRFAPGFLTIAQPYLDHWIYWMEVLLALAGIVYLVRLWRRSRVPGPWTLLLLWAVLHFLAYTLLGVSRYPWYYTSLVPGFIAAAGLGITAIRDGLHKNLSIGQTSLAMAGLLVSLLSLGQIKDAWFLRQQADPRYPTYQAAGEWLNTNTPKNAVIGVLEIGILGYYAQRPMVDFAGLLQPKTAAQLGPETTYQDAALWAISRYQPDYLVLQEEFFSEPEQSYIRGYCQLVQQIPGQANSHDPIQKPLNIYRCQEKLVPD